MVSCLILYHPDFSHLSITKILRAMFLKCPYETQVINHETTLIYVWEVEKIPIWQAAASFESTEILVGYGFGENQKEAHHHAWEIILTRIKVAQTLHH